MLDFGFSRTLIGRLAAPLNWLLASLAELSVRNWYEKGPTAVIEAISRNLAMPMSTIALIQ